MKLCVPLFTPPDYLRVYNKRLDETGHKKSQTGIMCVIPSYYGVQHICTNMPLSAVFVREG
jgi:hypothetical protein